MSFIVYNDFGYCCESHLNSPVNLIELCCRKVLLFNSYRVGQYHRLNVDTCWFGVTIVTGWFSIIDSTQLHVGLLLPKLQGGFVKKIMEGLFCVAEITGWFSVTVMLQGDTIKVYLTIVDKLPVFRSSDIKSSGRILCTDRNP